TALSDKIKYFREKIHLSPDINELVSDLDNSHKLMNLILDLVDMYNEEFQSIKDARNVLDFGDLEHLALRILEDDNIASLIRDTYQYVFVDEYQDVNDIQENILTHIYSPGRVFLVGDVKQSIYGFRNTNPQIFIDKTNTFSSPDNPHQTTIKLNYNFRSDKRVLEYINSVFNIVMTPALAGIDYLSDGQLRAGLPDVPDTGMPIVEVDVLGLVDQKAEKPTPETLYSVRDAQCISVGEILEAKSEAQIIISKIAEFLLPESRIFDLNTQSMRPVQFRDITLLVRSRGAYLDTIVNEIARVYPIESVTQDSVFLEYEVQVLFNYLRLLNNPCDDIALTSFLLSPIFDITETDLSHIRMHYPDCAYFYQCVQSYLREYDDALSQALRTAFDYLDEGSFMLINGTIYDLLNWFCDTTHYFSIILSLPHGQKRMDNVMGFINYFVGNPHNVSLHSFLSFVESNANTLAIEPASSATQDTIKIATMHHSKGLEYPICFLIDTGHGFNKDSTRGDILLSSTLGLGLFSYNRLNRTKNNTLSRTAITLSIIEKEFAEHQRLLYVAMTRAKNHLIIVGKHHIDRLTPHPTEFSIRNSGSNMALILSSLPSSAISALLNGQDKLIIHKGTPSEFVLRVFPVITDAIETTTTTFYTAPHNVDESSVRNISQIYAMLPGCNHYSC
ncbi:MAG: UvrD-helicase domain-containing protein, partial [Clostridia bacterium]|nr:UvrD-helicase domain-containing protein [Clostridia bacterium]